MDDRKRKRKEAATSLRRRSQHCIDHNCVVALKEDNDQPPPLVARYCCINPGCYNYKVETTIYKCSLCGKAASYPGFPNYHIKTKHPDRYSPPPLTHNDDNYTAFMDFSANDYNNDNDDTSVSQPHLKKPKIEPLYIHSLMTISEYLNSLHQSDVNYENHSGNNNTYQLCFPKPNKKHQSITDSIGNTGKSRYLTDAGNKSVSVQSEHEFMDFLFKKKLSAGRHVVQHVLGITDNNPHGRALAASTGNVVITEADALYHVSMCQLYDELTDRQMERVITLHNYARYRGDKLKLPENLNECKMIWHKDYHRSIYKNLPLPETVMPLDGNEYSYLSLEDIIRRNMATCSDRFPLPFSNFEDSPHGQSARGKEWLSSSDKYLDPIHDSVDEIYKIKVIIWSDGARTFWFKDASVHMCTATIGAPDGDHSGLYTYPIWIGPSSKSPKRVEQIFIDELNRLQKGQNRNGEKFFCYLAKYNRVVRVQVCPFAWIADRPEKGVRTGTLMGGNTHQCFMLSLDPSQIADKKPIVSCDRCTKLLYNPLFTSMNTVWNNECTKCRCFNLTEGIPFHAPEHYPKSQTKPPLSDFTTNKKSPGIVYSKKITFDVVKEAVKYTYRVKNGQVVGVQWSDQNCCSYIAVSGGGNHNLSKLISGQSKEKSHIKSVISENSKTNPINPVYVAAAKQQEQYRNYNFTPKDLPPVWSLEHFHIQNFVPALAHQLFLGVQKMICKQFLSTFIDLQQNKKGKRKSAFSKAMEKCLKKLKI